MRFEDAYEGWQNKRLTQEQAVQLLGLCARRFRRYVSVHSRHRFPLKGQIRS